MNEPVLTIRDLRASYSSGGGGRTLAVDGVSLTLADGEVLGLAGESGCGKSSLAKALIGFTVGGFRVESGTVLLGSEDVLAMSAARRRREIAGKRIATIPQSSLNSLNPTRTIGDFAADFMQEHVPGLRRGECRRRAGERFEAIGLPARILGDYPNQLSGGMRQRAVIGISTLLEPDVVIADEPSSALDVSSQRAVVRMLLGLVREGPVRSLIFITHDLPLLRHVADRIAVMYAGVPVETGSAEDVVFRPKHPYTRALMGSVIVPEKGMRERTPQALPGAPPKLSESPVHCRFCDRCSERRPDCEEGPEEVRVFGDRTVRCRYAE